MTFLRVWIEVMQRLFINCKRCKGRAEITVESIAEGATEPCSHCKDIMLFRYTDLNTDDVLRMLMLLARDIISARA